MSTKREVGRGETVTVTENRILAIEEEQKTMNKTLNDINTNVSKLADAQKFSNEMLSQEVMYTKRKLAQVAKVAENTARKVDRKEQQKKGQVLLIKKWSKIITALVTIVGAVITALVTLKII